jgi:high-affinity Fe2+/Pb2+ permease
MYGCYLGLVTTQTEIITLILTFVLAAVVLIFRSVALLLLPLVLISDISVVIADHGVKALNSLNLLWRSNRYD